MLAEYLQKGNTGDMVWSNVMPGVGVCYVAPEGAQEAPDFPTLQKEVSARFEMFFCLRGEMTLKYFPDRRLTLERQDVLLLLDCSDFTDVAVEGPLEGILVTVDSRRMGASPQTGCDPLENLHWDVPKVECRMAEYEGCVLLRNSAWSQAVFAVLQYLTRAERERYCVWKTTELLYLLSECDWPPVATPCCVPVNERMERRVREMCAYMERNLQEKLTISAVCSQFYLSPTSFKKYFRCIYGQPVHQWLQQRRMKRAADLLRSSDLTILQIAQGVGYDGLSQFNAMFKRSFGCTPKQYRNMSESVDLWLIPQDREG